MSASPPLPLRKQETRLTPASTSDHLPSLLLLQSPKEASLRAQEPRQIMPMTTTSSSKHMKLYSGTNTLTLAQPGSTYRSLLLPPLCRSCERSEFQNLRSCARCQREMMRGTCRRGFIWTIFSYVCGECSRSLRRRSMKRGKRSLS